MISKGVNIQIYTYEEFFEQVKLRGNKDLITEDFLINNGVLIKYIGKKAKEQGTARTLWGKRDIFRKIIKIYQEKA